jgi:hypothetical protein
MLQKPIRIVMAQCGTRTRSRNCLFIVAGETGQSKPALLQNSLSSTICVGENKKASAVSCELLLVKLTLYQQRGMKI